MTSPIDPSRRRFLAGAAGVGAVTAAGVAGFGSFAESLLASVSAGAAGGPVRSSSTDAHDPGLILVSIQLAGGLDFLEAVVPVDDRRYRRLRASGALDGDGDGEDMPTLHRLDDVYALNSMPHLARCFSDGDLAIVHGVGWTGSGLSHFDATDMWEKGSPDFGTTSGWLGRALTDVAGPDADALTAVSLGGVSASMSTDRWSPVGLRPEVPLPWTAEFIDDHPPLDSALRQLARRPGDISPPGLWERARRSQVALRDLGGRLGPVVGDPGDRFEDDDDEIGTGRLGVDLDLVADMIRAGLPTRAFHVTHDGYDTHRDQRYRVSRLLAELDRAIERFRARLGTDAGRVVVATWSEFGRRPGWNGDGTEHGTAGVGFVIGPPVRGGHHGDPPPLDRFDRDGNFVVTTDFRDYLSGITLGTFGADPGRVADGGNGPMDLVEA